MIFSIYLFIYFESGGSFENKIDRINKMEINKISICFFCLIYSGGSLENNINKKNIGSDLSYFPKRTWKFDKKDI